MIKKYKALIKAEQFDGSGEMIQKYHIYSSSGGMFHPGQEIGHLAYSEYGDDVDIGDWIATGVDGENFVIKESIFRKNYQEA